MPDYEPIQRVRIYLSERDKSAGQPLYLMTLELLQREGATGATVTRGIAGFGAGHRLGAAGAADLGPAAPIMIEWIDRDERIARVLPLLDELLPEALITVEDLRVYRGVLRSSSLFGERSVGDVMARDVAATSRQMLLREAAQLMLERRQALLAVLDEQSRVVGVISGGDLVRRAGLALPLRLIDALTPPERDALLDTLPARTLADAMTADLRVVSVEGPIPLAVGTLVEWGLDALPVIDRAGQFAGLFGVEQALRAALDVPHASEGRVRDAEPPTPVRLVMQMAVPTVAAATPLAGALEQLLGISERFLVVVDAGRPLGVLSDAQVLRRLDDPARAAWLEALRAPAAPLPSLFAGAMADATARDLADPAPSIDALAPQDRATQMMLDMTCERLLVVDEAGRLEGLLARRGLLRALAQASAR